MGGLAPLFMLAGAPGSGKSFLLPYLLRRADGLVVADVDEILEDGALLGVPIATERGAAVWPAYDRLWGRIVNLARRAGCPVLMLFTTPSLRDLDSDGPWAEPVRWALLDCPDDIRARRLKARGWSDEQVRDVLVDAACARSRLSHVIAGNDEPDRIADDVIGWTQSH